MKCKIALIVIVIVVVGLIFFSRDQASIIDEQASETSSLKTHLQAKSRDIANLGSLLKSREAYYDSLILVKDHEMRLSRKKIQVYENSILYINDVDIVDVADSISAYYSTRAGSKY